MVVSVFFYLGCYTQVVYKTNFHLLAVLLLYKYSEVWSCPLIVPLPAEVVIHNNLSNLSII